MGKNRQIRFEFDFLTDGQRAAWEVMKDNRVIFLTGPAGTAKTFLAVAYACRYAVELKRDTGMDKIYISRPTIEAGGSIGHLPGTLGEKIKPFLRPIYRIVEKLAGDDDSVKAGLMEAIDIESIGHLRGITFEHCVVIIDEAQNVSLHQMELILSRLGPNSKLIFCGDTRQSDIGPTTLGMTAEYLSRLPKVGHYVFGPEDNCRDPLVNDMLALTHQLRLDIKQARENNQRHSNCC